MALQQWNSIDQEPIDAQEYYCAFIDILGYKDKAEQFFQGKYNLEGRFNRALSSAKSVIELSSTLIPADKIDIKFFSDSIIIFLPKSDGTKHQLFSLLSFCGILAAHLSFDELFVRGGISWGLHRESSHPNGASFLASIALQRAYLLESQYARFPRILVDRELVPELSNEDKIVLAKDSGETFVHFSLNIVNNLGQNQDEVHKEMRLIKEAMTMAPNPGVAEKYKWLIDYYYWTLSEAKNVDMAKFSEFTPIKFNQFSKMA